MSDPNGDSITACGEHSSICIGGRAPCLFECAGDNVSASLGMCNRDRAWNAEVPECWLLEGAGVPGSLSGGVCMAMDLSAPAGACGASGKGADDGWLTMLVSSARFDTSSCSSASIVCDGRPTWIDTGPSCSS